MRQRHAVTLASYTGGVQQLLQQAVAAERRGYDDVWFADTGFPDALTTAAAVAERTRRVRIGIAVAPVYTRTPAVLAATAATLAELAPQRFVMGLGSSSQAMIEGWHGLRLEQPLLRIRETVALMRQIFSGKRSDFSGKTVHSHGYRQAPTPSLPLYLAALRPKMLETAAEIGDGVVLNLFPRSALPRIMDCIRAGAGRRADGGEVEVVCRYQVAVTRNPEEALAGIRKFLSGYFATPVYNRYLAWCGFPEAAAEIAAGWASGDRQRTARALPDELLREIAIVGDAAECRSLIRDCGRQGIHTHIITPVAADSTEHDETMDCFSNPPAED